MVWVELIVINIKMNNIKDPLQILQIWFSSSFPVGSYAYSHGLEAIIDNKLIKSKNDVEEFFSNRYNKFEKEWPQYQVLFTKKNISRKGCLLLPFQTLNKALKS